MDISSDRKNNFRVETIAAILDASKERHLVSGRKIYGLSLLSGYVQRSTFID